MNKICTSIEQSKKLIELGIDIGTADMRYGYTAPYDYSDRIYDGVYDEVPYPNDFLMMNPNFSENEYDSELPAWSLSALLELIPKFSLEKDVSNNAGYQLHYNYNTTYYDDPVDAAFKLICWLKKYNKI